MKTGIFGGTFDPPHLGHQALAMAAAKELGLDRLLLIPAKIPPHKDLASGGATAQQRLEMSRIMADCLGKYAQADDLELKREGKSYTADTLRELKERWPEDRFTLLLGSDMYLSIQDWREPEVIFSLAQVCGVSRKNLADAPELDRQTDALNARFGQGSFVMSFSDGVDVSSTQIRQELARGIRPDGLSDPVYGYILLNGLYGTHKDLHRLSDDDLRACSLSMVCAKRHRHILGVEEEAVKLARRWGEDETLARRAGILHDCTKYWPMERHLTCCQGYGLALDELELKSEKLLHSKTGSLVARHIFGESDAVCDAIYCHTTGKGDMTLWDKIIYIADYMEPNRDFPGVEKLRELAYRDLDAAVALGCKMSIAEMEEKGRQVHPNTSAALTSLQQGKEWDHE